jgi:sugar-specific transcriptional regulator TrmB
MPQSVMPDYLGLARLGLSKTAIKCYESLFSHGGASVPQLAERLKLSRTGLYRVLKHLETTGLVTSLKTASQPCYYFAEPIDKALGVYAGYWRGQLGQLISEQKEVLMKRSGDVS